MNVVIYIDIFFLVNFLINCMVCMILKKLMRNHSSFIRVILASVFGALLACIIVTYKLMTQPVILAVIYILNSFIMILILFGRCKCKKLLEYIFWFYVIAFLLGGLIYFLYQNYLIHCERFTLTRLLTGCIAGFIFLNVFVSMVQKKKRQMRNIFPVTISNQGNTLTTMGLLDTGNGLKEPITKKPVIVVEYDFIKPILKKEPDGVFYIPYSSLGNEKGNLLGINVDFINVDYFGTEKRTEKPLLGLYKGRISIDDTYQIILHEDYINF